MATAGIPDEENSPPPDVLGLSQRRKSAQVLSPLLLQSKDETDFATPEAVQQAQVEGIEVYTEFLELQLQAEDLPNEELEKVIQTVECHARTVTSSLEQSSDNSDISNSSVTSHGSWRKKGKHLQQLVKDFEKSLERRKVRQEAERVVSDESNITKDHFLELMEGFFHDGHITSHSIVVLFTFCSDVIVLAVKKYANKLFAKFLDWAVEYIKDKVCAWVAENGGWDAVLSQPWVYVKSAAKLFLAGVILYISYRLIKSSVESITKK